LGARSNLDFSVLSPVGRNEAIGMIPRETAQEVHSELAMK
jgi:hypothetical protein